MGQPKKGVTILDRFILSIEVNDINDCWLWKSSASRNDYGRIKDGTRGIKAHRYSYETFVDKIPKGLFVCHKCDNPPCINPKHLFLGTNADNIRDSAAKGRLANSKKTYCPQGHEYSEVNTYLVKQKGSISRRCRECYITSAKQGGYKHQKAWYERQKLKLVTN